MKAIFAGDACDECQSPLGPGERVCPMCGHDQNKEPERKRQVRIPKGGRNERE